MTTRLIELTEWLEQTGVPLDEDEVLELQHALPEIQIRRSTEAGTYSLRSASNKVGVVELEQFTVRILPAKCSPELVVFMLSYANGTKHLEQLAPFESSNDLWEAMVRSFNHQLTRALRTGVHRSYRNEDDALAVIRGRIRIGDQLRTRYRLSPPIEVSFDDYTDDITENRILKAAINRCHQLPLRSAELRTGLRHHEAQLANVQHVEFDPWRPPHIAWTRLNEHLRPAVELGLLILKGTSIELDDGAHRAPGFLVDMADVFEDFVIAALRDSLGLDDRSFPQGSRRLRLSERINLEPDFSWWEAGRCIAIGDVKYKATNAQGVLHPDLYQVFAYAMAAELDEATLIYAKSKIGASGDEAARTHEVANVGKRLRVKVLDLDHGPERALRELERIAVSLRTDSSSPLRLVDAG